MSGNKSIIVLLAMALLVAVGLTIYVLLSDEESPAVVSEDIAIPAATPETAPEPGPEPEPEPVAQVTREPVAEPEPDQPRFVLPSLDDSDELVRDGVISLSRHQGINAWLAPGELIRKFVAVVDNLSRGQVARDPVRFLVPEGSFLVIPIDEESYTFDPVSYRRYDSLTDIVVSIDARRAAEFYQLLRPLFQKAYSELGYGDADFDSVIFNAIGRVLETPVIDTPITLKRPVVMFEYEDAALEGLSPVQKQMIRMGPRNTRLLQTKIRQLETELRAVLGY